MPILRAIVRSPGALTLRRSNREAGPTHSTIHIERLITGKATHHGCQLASSQGCTRTHPCSRRPTTCLQTLSSTKSTKWKRELLTSMKGSPSSLTELWLTAASINRLPSELTCQTSISPVPSPPRTTSDSQAAI